MIRSASSVSYPPRCISTFDPSFALLITLAAIYAAVGPPSAIGFQSIVSMSHMKVLV